MAFLTHGQTGQTAARLVVQGFNPEIEHVMVHIMAAKNAWAIILTPNNAIHITALVNEILYSTLKLIIFGKF